MHLWLNSILLGILEGITEFLPISSTGHLILVRRFLPLGRGFEDTFDIVVQLPAILAIVVLYRQRLWDEAVGVVTKPQARRFWLGLFFAFLPAAVIGFFFHNKIESYLFKPRVVAIALLLGGVVILLVERFMKEGGREPAEAVPMKSSFGIGLFQCLAMIPGTSRSAATIIGGRLLGLNRAAAAEYSFFLALPTMFAATGFQLLKRYKYIEWGQYAVPLLLGSLASFVTAYLVVAWFIRFLKTRTLSAFGWYRIALALVVIAAVALGANLES